GEQHL
ncbi:hypothetical protein JCM10213_004635, partial [Rhodosporidiobolus nylandii]